MENSIEHEVAGGQIAAFAITFRDAEKHRNVFGIFRSDAEEIGGKQIGVVFAEFVEEKVLFVVENGARKRTRSELIDAVLGGGERVEAEKRLVCGQILTVETNALQIAYDEKKKKELSTD